MEKQRAPPKQRRVTVFWRSKEKYVTVAAAGIITAAAKKEIGSGYMTADERRRKAIEGYYKAYREYKKLDTVREHMRVEGGLTGSNGKRFIGSTEGRSTRRGQKHGKRNARKLRRKRCAAFVF